MSWISSPRPGGVFSQHLEDGRVEHVAADDGQLRGRLAGGGLLHQVGHPDDVVLVGRARSRRSRRGEICSGGDLHQRDHAAAVLPRTSIMRVSSGSRGSIRSSPSRHGERLVADVLARRRAPRARGPAGRPAARSAGSRGRLDFATCGEPSLVALRLERLLQLEGPVEVVLDGALVPAGDHEDVVQAGRRPPPRRHTGSPACRRSAASPWGSPWSPAGSGCRGRPRDRQPW